MDDKRILGNIALPEFIELIYKLDSEGTAIKITDENKHRVFSVLHDSETIKVNSEGELYLPLDGVTVYFDDSEQVIKAAGLEVKPGIAVNLTNSEEGGLPVRCHEPS